MLAATRTATRKFSSAADNLRFSELPPLSSLTTSTIAAPRAWRTIARVIAIRAYPGSEDPQRKRSREVQSGFKAAACRFSPVTRVRRSGLRTRTFYCWAGESRRVWCSYERRCGCRRHGRTRLSRALPLAVFPHPGRSLCWIAIRHTFYSDACSVYRVPVDPVTT
jgi:hypothetical protein